MCFHIESGTRSLEPRLQSLFPEPASLTPLLIYGTSSRVLDEISLTGQPELQAN